MKLLKTFFLLSAFLLGCTPKTTEQPQLEGDNFIWENATIYFLLTDRFYNGDNTNDENFGRKQDAAPLRGFMGGDLRGVIKKLDDGYFEALGVTAIWTTPVFEQIKGAVDEGYGTNYGFHGYWMRDWTTLDPNFGTMEDLAELVAKAHAKGIRIVMDVVLNHTGPVSELDSQWPDAWVRTSPTCTYTSYESTIKCTLVENLPDIRTESDEEVELPAYLIEKWREEGRLEQELASLDEFFAKTGFPRAPRYYIMKWLVDYVERYGVDAYRVDTVKHVEEDIWAELYALALDALKRWKESHPAEKPDDKPFFMLGEVYFYNIFNGREYTFDGGEVAVDYHTKGFQSLINFAFRDDAVKPAKEIFPKYSRVLNSPEWKGLTTLNYISSHDDGGVPDKERSNIIDAGTKLLLSNGMAQIYYGDETGRKLNDPSASGDAVLRSFMNWDELEKNVSTQAILAHWQKIGQFRKRHFAVGAGIYEELQETPYTFAKTYNGGGTTDVVAVVLDAAAGDSVTLKGAFADGTLVRDAYSGSSYKVENGKITVSADAKVILLEQM